MTLDATATTGISEMPINADDETIQPVKRVKAVTAPETAAVTGASAAVTIGGREAPFNHVTRLVPVKFPTYVDRAVGLKNFPYPTLDEKGGIVALMRPLTLATTLDHDRMMGRAYRDMVVPSMLPLFEEAIRLRSLATPRNLQLILGAPAVGKSYLAYMISKMRTEEGALIVDCAGKNLDELLFEFSLEKDGSGAGIAMRPGRLTEAFLTGREIIPDEYNKAKAGSGTALNQVLQVYTGELDRHTVRRGGLEVTFDRSQFSPEHFITATGNYTEDGPSTQELSASEYSRWQPKFIPALTERDWAHRISQRLTGVPLTTLYDMANVHWQKDPRTFRKFLTKIRTLGLTPEEVRNIPGWQTDLIASWEQTMPACQQLGSFMAGWYGLMNAKGRGTAGANLPAGLKSEIDDSYRRRVGMDMRKMIEMIFNAVDIKSPTTSLNEMTALVFDDSWFTEPDPRTVAPEPVLRNFGSRMQMVISHAIDDTTVPFGKEILRKSLMKAGEEAGIFPMATSSRRGNLRTLDELLNIEAPGLSILPEHRLLQKHICDFIRLATPAVPPDDEVMLPIAEIVSSLDGITEQQARATETPAKARDIITVGLTTSRLSGAVQELVSAGSVIDSFKVKFLNIQGAGIRLPDKPADYIGLEDFLFSLTLPTFGTRNLDTLWNRNISELGGPSSAEDLKIAEATHDKVAVQYIVCAGKDATGEEALVPLTLVHAKKTGETVVFGQPVLDANLVETLSDAKITYISGNMPDTIAEMPLSLMLDAMGSAALLKENIAAALGRRIYDQAGDKLMDRLRRPSVNFGNAAPLLLLNRFRVA